MEFTLSNSQINTLKQGLSYVNKGLLKQKEALKGQEINPDQTVRDYYEIQIRSVNEMYMLFEILQNHLVHEDETITLQKIK